MSANFKFNIGNCGLLAEEVGLADRVNARLRASGQKHGVQLKPGSMVTVKRVRMGGGKVVLRVSAEDKEPVEVPLAAA